MTLLTFLQQCIPHRAASGARTRSLNDPVRTADTGK